MKTMTLDVQDLTHSYGQTRVLHGLTFAAQHGIVGLLGRNGAGKSTLLRILATLLKPSEGSVWLRGEDVLVNPKLLRRAAVYLPQDMGFPPDVSARVYVRYLLSLRGVQAEAADRWLTEFDLAEVMDDKLGSFSGGMRQRVAIAYALAADAQILLLDEPTQSLDSWERLRFYSWLAKIAKTRLILFSTHITSDIEAIASRLLVLDRGVLQYDGVPKGLIEQTAPSTTWVLELQEGESWQATSSHTVTSIRRVVDGHLEIRGVGEPVPNTATLVHPTLEESYLRLTATSETLPRLSA